MLDDLCFQGAVEMGGVVWVGISLGWVFDGANNISLDLGSMLYLHVIESNIVVLIAKNYIRDFQFM